MIDLGERRSGPSDEPPPPARLRHRREWTVAAVVALALLVIGAATPSHPTFRVLGRVYALPGDSLLADGDRLYVAKTRETPATLAAYDVRNGATLWSVPYPAKASLYVSGGGGLSMSNGLIVALGAENSTGVAAVDPATGRTVWRADTIYADFAGGRDMLVGDEDRTTMSLLDGGTGATRWSQPLNGCDVNPLADGPDVFALRCAGDTELRLVDAATGQVRATRDMSAFVTPGDQGYNLIMADGTLAVFSEGSVVGLRVDDLGVRWPPVKVPADAYPYPCDDPDHICATLGDSLVRLDASTGRIVSPLALDIRPPDAPPVSVSGAGRRSGPPAAVLAPLDPTAPLSSGLDAVLTMADGSEAMPIFAGAYPTWVFRAVRDPRAPIGYRFRPVGRLGGVLASACFATRRYFACATATGELTFYAVSASP